MIVVLLLAAGAGWEVAALRRLGSAPDIVVLKRCVDVDDLLATAAAGQADVAVLGLDAPGLDPTALDHLRDRGVRAVGVMDAALVDAEGDATRLLAARLGVGSLVAASELASLPEAVLAAARDAPEAGAPSTPGAAGAEDAALAVPAPVAGPVLAVWGPPGAPGRSTLAVGVAAELGRRGRRTVLVDADPQAASLAQQLGILDEVSGLLAAARLAASGALPEELHRVERSLDPCLSVVTGLPRPDRWRELRPGAVETLLRAARTRSHVVVDTGASLDQDAAADLGSRPGRNLATLEALACADEVLVVGSADPVGLARLSRGLVELGDVLGPVAVRVVVNRMRSSLGWREDDVRAMVAGFAETTAVHFLPQDQAATDRALVSGRTLVESGDTPLRRALSGLVDALDPAGPRSAGPSDRPSRARRGRSLSRRRAGRGHRR